MSLKVYDYHCRKCKFNGEAWVEDGDNIICSECASLDTVVVWRKAPAPGKQWRPYNYLDKRPPDDYNPTVSVPKNYKKGKKDGT